MLVDSLTKIDPLSLIPGTVKVFSNKDSLINQKSYRINHFNSTILYKGDLPVKLRIEYATFSIDLTYKTSRKDTSIISARYKYENPFRIDQETKNDKDLFNFGGLNKSGSLSRAITVGNNQNLAVNSNFNLQLSGKLSEGISVVGSITDNNIPIQPDGNTQQLQDFDQVYIQLYDENNWSLTAGDFITLNQDSYFMRYNKKARGMSFEKTINLKDSTLLFSKTDLAISRGKFATNRIQGIEGNQGPYKLIGAENEQTIIVLSGTEQIFIDGKLLKRGADNDYTIDYNAAEVTFTAKQLITKNKRIVIQFQYSDKNFVRSLTQSQFFYSNKKWKSSIHFYSEQDHKNQPLHQTLNDPEKKVLFDVGDNINNAFIYRIDSSLNSENTVNYIRKDSLGYTVYEYNPKADSNLFTPNFSLVGEGNGNYVQDGFSPFGRVYKWVKPDTISGQIILNGNYEPVILLIAPKRKQLITFENTYKFSENTLLNGDIAVSNTDINTFSPNGNQNNIGLGGWLAFKTVKKLSSSKDAWKITNLTSFEFINKDFEFIERYRPVEFSRNWNILNQPFDASQLIGSTSLNFSKKSLGALNYSLDILDIDKAYRGIKNGINTSIFLKNLKADYNGSLLETESDQTSRFYRHKGTLDYRLGKISLGYEDETELNIFKQKDSLISSSYQFYDGSIYVKSNDTSKNQFKVYGRYRDEKNSINQELRRSAFSNDVGVNYTFQSKKRKTRLFGNSAYRKLTILDSNLGKAPENTLVNQANFTTSFLKRFIQWNTYYEVGSGLEQKREFVYIQVNSGQGTYAWIDYNENGIEELNEFEIALYQDQANYIRVFTQSNQYITAYNNGFSQSINIDPKRLIGKTKNSFLMFVSKFSNLSSYKTERKTTQENFKESLNPFVDNVSDSSLLSLNKQFRTSFFYNRTGFKYGVGYNYQNNKNKTLLSNGFDSKTSEFHQLNMRYKIKKWLYNWQNEIGDKSLSSDYASSRNYDIAYFKSEISITLQKDPNQFGNIFYAYEEKKNQIEGEYAVINKVGGEITYNMVNKINLVARINYLNIIFNSSENTSLAYEMLEGLKQGNNFTWEILLNKRIAKNLSLTLNYNGRKPEGVKTIHSGTIEIRAFF